MKQAFLLASLYSGALFLLFCLDLWSFFFIGQPILFLVPSFLIALLFNRPFSMGLTGWAFLLISSELSLQGLPSWYALIAMTPTIIAILSLREHLFPHVATPAIALALSSAIDLLILRPLLGGIALEWPYTIGVIFANIMVTLLFSIKLKTGKIRQSLTQYSG